MTLIPTYTKEQILKYIDAVELLRPELYESPKKEKILKELIQFGVQSQQQAQSNISREQPYSDACGCIGGPEGCSMCNCELYSKTYLFRFHLYLHYFYSDD